VRGDEWSDPWMRSKSPAGRKGAGRKRSYSSGSSYSSSSSSRSSSESSRSSFRSRSRSHNKRPARSHRSRHVSPSVIVSERKAANERAALMNPPAPRKRAPSPGTQFLGII
jgi:nuclear protein NHN1